MRLHEIPDDFRDLITLAAQYKHIPEAAAERDYYIVYMLQKLEQSEFAEKCVFKGGTSLSKCYPGSIERFSEDIDLTFLGMDLPDKECSRSIKRIESIMTVGANTEPIASKRSNRSKSMFVWFDDEKKHVKLEIGSSVRPDPYSKRSFKTYIQEYLEDQGYTKEVGDYELTSVTLNVLEISRTFIDKLMAVKRHAMCGDLSSKVRHVYDVFRLYQLPEIQGFLNDKEELKRLVRLTKETDSFYLGKRNIAIDYDPREPYQFGQWKGRLGGSVRHEYEQLHEDLLYTTVQQNFDDAVSTLEEISGLLASIGE